MYSNLAEIDINWLKGNHQIIHYFGLGFIQLKINERYRLHFYSRELPPIVGEEDVHNHRYDFTSSILRGELCQKIYRTMEGKEYVIEKESCQPGHKTKEQGGLTGLKLMNTSFYSVGSKYFLDHETLHRVEVTEDTVTLLDRSQYKKDLADVARKIGERKVCPFSLKIEEAELWAIIERMICE